MRFTKDDEERVLTVSASGNNDTLFYDAYYGVPMDDAAIKIHVKQNTTFWCINEFKPCDLNEWRRIGGSCNNLKHPSRGTSHTPFYRILPAVYHKERDFYNPRKADSGDDLPLVRSLRTNLLSEGKVPDQIFSHLIVHLLLYLTSDLVSLHDTVNYVAWKPYCCDERGKTDSDCINIAVPADDPVHRFSDIRCLNLTRPMSYQSLKCTKDNETEPERIVSSTPHLDLSQLYGNNMKRILERGRTFKGGLLKTEIVNGRIWPPSTKSRISICLMNDPPAETRCHGTPEDATNTILAISMFSIWMWRYHNQLAAELSQINPCWDDDMLFYTAREIAIATYLQIIYYEATPLLVGRENLVHYGIISPYTSFRDIYNEDVLPQLSIEYTVAMRWFHKMQAGDIRLYDAKGHYLRQYPQVNLTLRAGWLALDDHIDLITQGFFRQPAAKISYVVDPAIAQHTLGRLQRSADAFSADLTKNRFLGLQPYVKYLEYCYGKPFTSFKDLTSLFDPEMLEILRNQYKHINDVDFLAGLWLERAMDGGHVPPTLYCFMRDQLLRNIVSDRHWYERADRPHAFTHEQLQQIRKTSIARLLCDVGDTVSEIQPQAFLRPGPGNKMTSCKHIPGPDLNAWKDESCFKHHASNEPKKWLYNQF